MVALVVECVTATAGAVVVVVTGCARAASGVAESIAAAAYFASLIMGLSSEVVAGGSPATARCCNQVAGSVRA